VYLQENGLVNDSIQHQITMKQKPYRVQVNDVLSIRVKALDQQLVMMFNPIGEEGNINSSTIEQLYFDGFTVNAHGNIRIPTVGEINVLNYTIDEIRKMIENKLLQEYFKKEANVFVNVKLAGMRFTVNGEVQFPGTKVLYEEKVNIFEAIANVGEINLEGDRRDVILLRNYPQGQKIHHLDLTSVDIMNSPYYFIQPNDVIYVKPMKQKSWGTGRTGFETFTTVVSILSFLTTTVLLIKNL
jgi:polysaccharide export outer membrane protein